MFDVGFWELVLVFGMGLMILGPERLPKVATQVGRWVNRARRTATQLRRQLESEIDLNEPPKYQRPPSPPKPAPSSTAHTDDDPDPGAEADSNTVEPVPEPELNTAGDANAAPSEPQPKDKTDNG